MPNAAPSEKASWQAVMAAAYSCDPHALATALREYRSIDPETGIPVETIVGHPITEGNSFAMAMELLANTRNGIPGLTECARLLSTDWMAHGGIVTTNWSENADAIAQYFADAIRHAEPERIRAVFSLLNEEADKPIIANLINSEATLSALLLIQDEHKRIACIKAYKHPELNPNFIARAIGSTCQADNIAQILTPDTLKELLASANRKKWRSLDELCMKLLEIWPSEKLLETAPDMFNSTHTNSITSWLKFHIENNPPDPARLATDANYRERWEDRRRGILSAASRCSQLDASILETIAAGLKGRVDEWKRHPDQDPSHFGRELRFYAFNNLLENLYEKAGKDTGYASNLEYLTALRENIFQKDFGLEPLVEQPELFSRVDWAEYVRSQKTGREGTALQDYSKGPS